MPTKVLLFLFQVPTKCTIRSPPPPFPREGSLFSVSEVPTTCVSQCLSPHLNHRPSPTETGFIFQSSKCPPEAGVLSIVLVFLKLASFSIVEVPTRSRRSLFSQLPPALPTIRSTNAFSTGNMCVLGGTISHACRSVVMSPSTVRSRNSPLSASSSAWKSAATPPDRNRAYEFLKSNRGTLRRLGARKDCCLPDCRRSVSMYSA
jgi:hypothetical protein